MPRVALQVGPPGPGAKVFQVAFCAGIRAQGGGPGEAAGGGQQLIVVAIDETAAGLPDDFGQGAEVAGDDG